MAITLLGKVLGLYRDHLMAVHYGTTGMEAKAFYIASRIPRVFFDVVFASAIAACFIPVFSEYLTKKGKKEAFRFGGNFLPSPWSLCLPTVTMPRLRPWPHPSPGPCSPRCCLPE